MFNLFKKSAIFIFQIRQKFFISRTQIRFAVFLHDICMIPIAWALAYWLRFNLGEITPAFVTQAIHVLPIIIVVQSFYYWLFGLYRGVWRFASLPDLIRIVKVVVAGCLSCIVILFLTAQLSLIPRSIFPLYGLLLVMLLGGSRFLYRGLKNSVESKFLAKKTQQVLIVGAGQAGESIARDLKRQVDRQYQVVGFIDDAQNKKGQEIHGIRVLGESKDIPALVKKHNVDLVILAIPSASSADMRRIVGYCEQAKIPCRTLPSLQDLANGHVQIDTLRAVSLEDLLGRDPVLLDRQNISKHIKDKIILVSGGGGSIGSELCRQVAQFSPKELVVIEQNEFNLYMLTLALQQKFPQLNFTGHLLDVTDRAGVAEILKQKNIDIIFHAAAYKHVPMLENQIRIAVKNNILGTHILAEEAIKTQVKKFILISTDKAVNPANIMGATKRVAEILCQNQANSTQTKFITVRFGNVLGSTGSVVPLFKKQIEAGGPVTVTHPDITRFFMTIPEAAQLILQATVMGKGDEIFVLDMGEPVKIQYLAEQMIMLAGLVPGRDIAIEYSGLRPGEKLYEELFHQAEPLVATEHEKILRAHYRKMDEQVLLATLVAISHAVENADEKALYKALGALVPEYCRDNS